MKLLFYKNEIDTEVENYIKQNNLNIKIKILDPVTEEILKFHEIINFPCLINWSSKVVYADKNILSFLKKRNLELQ